MIKKSIRFEVFARDSFTCQYCGNTPPTIVLEVDHILPKSKGGSDAIENLTTSCFDCNRGKGSRIRVNKRDLTKDQESLIEKEEQLKAYHKVLLNREKRKNKDILEIEQYFFDLVQEQGHTFTETLKLSLSRFLNLMDKYKIKEAFQIAHSKRYYWDSERKIRYALGVLHNMRRQIQGQPLKNFKDLENA